MYSFTSKIRYSECDENCRLKELSLINYFQDCSSFQSESNGMGVRYLKDQHRVWVLSAWQIVINELPKFGDEVRISTFPYEFRGFFGMRNFMMRPMDVAEDDKDPAKAYAYANSIWTYLETDHLTPVRAGTEVMAAYPLEDKIPMEYAPRKLLLLKDEEQTNKKVMPEIIAAEHHLDSNHHVNNGQYVAMAMDVLGEAGIHLPIRELRVEYRKAAYLGDVLYPTLLEGERNGKREFQVQLQNQNQETFANVELFV